MHHKSTLMLKLNYDSRDALNADLAAVREKLRHQPDTPPPNQANAAQSTGAQTNSIPQRTKAVLVEYLQRRSPALAKSRSPHSSLYSSIPASEVALLLRRTKLSRKQLKFQIDYLSSNMGTVTDEKREFLSRFLHSKRSQSRSSHKSRLKLSQDDYLYLEKHLQLSRFQLYSMIHYALEKPGHVTSSQKQILHHIMLKRYDSDTQHYKPFTPQEFDQLRSRFSWSSYQLRFQIKRIREKDSWKMLTPQTKKQVHDFFQQHSNPSKEQLENLRSSLNLNKDQFRGLCFRIENSPKFFHEDKRAVVRSWLEKNANRRPSSQEMQHLIQETNLSRIQINDMIRSILDPAQPLTPEKKELLSRRLKELSADSKDSAPLSNDVLKSLQEECQLGMKQLRNLISRIQDPMRPFSKEKKESIRKYVEEIGFVKPSPEQMQELHNKVDLSRRQITEHVSHILYRPTHCSSADKKLLEEWMEEHGYPSQLSEEERSELLGKTELNSQQLGYRLSRIRYKSKKKANARKCEEECGEEGSTGPTGF